MDGLADFREVWLCDCEFYQPDGERPEPICLVAREWRTGRMFRVWQDRLTKLSKAPFSTGPDSLIVAYYASAELGCFLSLGWPFPQRILDLCAEFRCHTSGLTLPVGEDKKRRSLLCALTYHGLDGIAATEKQSMRDLAMRGGQYTATERRALLDYCQSDVDALAKLLPAMLPAIDVPRALLRGRYMGAAARIEWTGVPLDTEALFRIKENWHRIKARLIAAVDRDYGVFVPTGRAAEPVAAWPNDSGDYLGPMTFSTKRWARYLARKGIPWPQLPSGALALDDDTFRQMARAYPADVAPIRELRHALGQLRLQDLAVGSDGRNRVSLFAFGSRTGRNQPSNASFIFGPSCWLRSDIRPGPGRAIAYVDWCGQEYGIAAALSGDKAMQRDYQTGEPYLAFGKRIGAVPADATKQTHRQERDRLKVCCGLGAMYGAGPATVAATLGIPEWQARDWLRAHRETYATYWRWSDAAVNQAMLAGQLQATFGWMVHVGADANPRSLRNFPMQANGAEMLRLACILATERGIRVCAPVHDALLVEGPADEIEAVVEATQTAMREASELVLPGFPLRTEAMIVRYPDRYMDPRGARFWDTVWRLIGEIDGSAGATPPW